MSDEPWPASFTRTTVVTAPCECGLALKMRGFLVCRKCFKRRHLEIAIQRRVDKQEKPHA
jgi:hypothetical protein